MFLHFFGSVYKAAYSQNSLIYSGEGRNIIDDAEVYEDKTNSLTFDDIKADQDKTIHFQRLSDAYQKINNENTYWYKISFLPTVITTESWLQIDPSWLDYVTLYQLMPNGNYIKQVSGKYVNPLVKPFTYRFPLFKLTLQQNQPTVVYIQVKTRVGQLLMLRFWHPSIFMQHESKAQLGWGIYFGISFLMIIASLWFERVIKDKIYGIFSLYVFCAAVLNFAITGWWYEWLYELFGIFFFPIITLSMLWLQFISILFVFKLVELEKQKPSIYRWYIGTLFIYTCLFSVMMFNDLAGIFIQINYVVTLFIIMPSGFIVSWKAIWMSPPVIKRIMLTVGVITFITSGISILSLLHVLPYNDLIANAPTISLLVPFLLFFYSLSKRYQMLRDENIQSGKKLLEVTQDSERKLKKLVEIKTKDLSDAKVKIEKALHTERQAYEEQRNFIAMVSHEFRTPLAIIDATLQNLLRLKDNPTLLAKYQKIARSTERLTALMSNYLTQDRINVFLKGVKAEWFDLKEVVLTEKDLVEALTTQHPFIYVVPDNAMIFSDKDIIKLVLHTLVENAVKYTPVNTPIHLVFHESKEYWYIDVIDEGPGVDDEKELIFNKFYRGRTSSNQVGTGLGLTLARNLMRMQGGDLTLEDVTDHIGCCFRLSSPKNQQNMIINA